MAALPGYLSAQEEGKPAIPLDHFYAKPLHGASPFRRILKDFHFGMYSGIGRTYFNSKVGKGRVLNIPLAATLHYEFNRYRVGAGYSYELMSMGSFRSNTTGDQSSLSGTMRKYWGMAGVSFYRWNDFLFTADVQVGSYKMKSNFNSSQAVTSTYFNFGITAEKNLSEYFKVFVRPYYEIKSYSFTPPAGQPVQYNINGLYATVGFTYSIPELPRCFLRDCHAQINHAHGNKEYRSRRHPIYKKQNPGYGENDPVLLKYKGKNKKKLDPY